MAHWFARVRGLSGAVLTRRRWLAPCDAESVDIRGDGLFLYAGARAIEVRSAGWLGVATAGHLVWLPGCAGAVRVRSEGPFCGAMLQGVAPPFAPGRPRVMDARPLLDGLLRRLEQMPQEPGASNAELMSLLLHEMHHARPVASCVSLPVDPRLATVCERIEATLHLNHEARVCAAGSGLSARTLQRLFTQECGLATAAWIRKRRLIEALYRMGQGESVPAVGRSLGYRSFSGFGAMVRKTMGVGPRQFQARAAVTAMRGAHAELI
jgi:AraC-like DNA-binding protein